MGKKDIRRNFREGVLERDGNRCMMCTDTNAKLDAHHITDRSLMPNGGYVLENGISLCDKQDGCHMKAERWHISGETEFIPGYHPDDLYKLINSSYELAYQKSELL